VVHKIFHFLLQTQPGEHQLKWQFIDICVCDIVAENSNNFVYFKSMLEVQNGVMMEQKY
jgi:hypothetical protein